MEVSSQSIFQWLTLQPKAFIDRLYGSNDENDSTVTPQSVFACKAIFQSLSYASKNVLLRIIFNIDSNVDSYSQSSSCKDNSIHIYDQCATSREEIKIWFKNQLEAEACINELKSLHILYESVEDIGVEGDGDLGGESSVSVGILKMHLQFHRCLMQAILNPTEPWSSGGGSSSSISGVSSFLIDDDNIVPEIQLEQYRLDKWNAILKFMMNLSTPTETSKISKSIIEFLRRHLNLIVDKNGTNLLTSQGYEFMLRDYQGQVNIH
jgi:hypothetical protein